jgi:sugar lactone lactonase YvrE
MTLGSYYREVEARQCVEWSDIRDRRTVYYSYCRGVEARQCLEWSDIRDRRTVYYSYSALWKFLSALILLQLTKC